MAKKILHNLLKEFCQLKKFWGGPKFLTSHWESSKKIRKKKSKKKKKKKLEFALFPQNNCKSILKTLFRTTGPGLKPRKKKVQKGDFLKKPSWKLNFFFCFRFE